MTTPLVLYFGCWDRPGHFLVGPKGRRVTDFERGFEHYGMPGRGSIHLDGTLAPRLYQGQCVWTGSFPSHEAARTAEYRSSEFPQGQYLLHHLDYPQLPHPVTVLSFWDRTQGDQRGGCSSAVLVEGKQSADTVLTALEEHFPSVVRNLKTANVNLVDVTHRLG